MKQLKLIITISSTLLLFTACGSSTPVAPSQNSALNSITDSNGKEKSGYMQQGLDSWLEDDWTPTVEQDKEVRTKYMEKVESNSSKENVGSTEVQYVEKKNKNFTLQEYVDKSAAYFKAHPNDDANSNVEKLNSMPAIGK